MSDKIDEKVIREYLEKMYKDIENNPVMKSISGNFTNQLYEIDDNAILKVFTGEDGKQRAKNEISFIKENQVAVHFPKIGNHSDETDSIGFVLYEKINGMPLSSIWDDIDDNKRKKLFYQVMQDIRSIHEKEVKQVDWKSKIMNSLESNIKKVNFKESFKNGEEKIIKDSLKIAAGILTENPKFARIHGSLNFDNIFYDMHNCILIDYENSTSAPIDYEVAELIRNSKYPKSREKKVNKENYVNIKDWIFEFYPELANVKNIEQRLAIYDLDYYLKILSDPKNKKTNMRKYAKRAFKAALVINKFQTLTYDRVKNESELMQYMEMCISYGWIDKNGNISRKPISMKNYRTMSLEATIDYGVGTSIEQSNMAALKFKSIGLDSKVFVLLNEDNRVYAFTIFNYKDKWYHFEHTNKKLLGVHSYDTLKDAVEFTSLAIKGEYNMEDTQLIETDFIPSDMSYDELLSFLNSRVIETSSLEKGLL